ncbi:hypothetical protein E5Q_04989 [Mixia osmundae IAM 14324]|uniref:HORMA domain-containing protein n=1 Tax=Mixia osmundae (strain CBS 9802 / IAM 14324 / JCM 22182 / KY 12970) TaxID=764103 RepID=G7E645_MIXOS|nr:hypothetical protein E5Q_04989 [Mixia osmundae IAM 14324]
MSTSVRTRQVQDVASDQKQITQQQSLQACKTLLSTGIGCIAYLRGLFPENGFVERKISSSAPATADQSKSTRRPGTSGVRVKQLLRNRSQEADRLLDYLEQGVYDALERSFLRSLLFAVFLDPEDQQNLVECYTFNFSYASPADGPQMSITRTGLTGEGFTFEPETQGNVKKQVQSLIRRLVAMTQSLSELPRRRFITMKLYYTPTCPADYQPPFFKEAQVDADRFYFGTRSAREEPERTSLGRLETGFHGVSVNVCSVASHLPEHVSPTVARQARTDDRETEIVRNRAFAQARKVVWDAETACLRTEAQEDAEAVAKLAQSTAGMTTDDVDVPARAEKDTIWGRPLGRWDARGNIVPIPVGSDGLEDGEIDEAADNARILQAAYPPGRPATLSQLEPTQRVEPQKGIYFTPPPKSLRSRTAMVERHVSPTHPSSEAALPASRSDPDATMVDVDELAAKDKLIDLEATQEEPEPAEQVRPARPCDCGDARDDGTPMICCDGCSLWVHAACYGHFQFDAKKVPHSFFCFQCSYTRLLDGRFLPIIAEGQIESHLENLRSLALFRRALVVAYHRDSTPNAIELKQKLSVDLSTAAQMLRRMQAEGYVNATVDERSGAAVDILDGSKSRGKAQPKLGTRLAVNRSMEARRRRNRIYFTPGGGNEVDSFNAICAIISKHFPDQTPAAACAHVAPIEEEHHQHMPEAHLINKPFKQHKRSRSDAIESTGPGKRAKVSLSAGTIEVAETYEDTI